MTGGRVDILIGTDRSPLFTVLKSRIGGDYEPTAVRNGFGWLIRSVARWNQNYSRQNQHYHRIDPIGPACRRDETVL